MEKLAEHKPKLAAIALVLLIASAMLTLCIPVKAQLAEEQPYTGPPKAGDVPDITLDTKAHLSFRPNPIGLGQPVLVNIWVAPPTAGGSANKYLRGFEVTLTKPDETEVVVGPLDTYPSSSTWFDYPVDQTGTWTIKFDFPGNYFPAGRYYDGFIVTNTSGTVSTESVYYKPSSDGPYELVVQEEMVYSWPPSPLPTDYWTRPVLAHNREWTPILGNYPWSGPGGPEWDELYPDTNTYPSNYLFTPYVQAPNSAHIVWKRQNEFAGLLGYQSKAYSWGSPAHYPDVIYQGRGYEVYEKPGSGTTPKIYWMCYDIRTGELIWEQPAAYYTTYSPIWGLRIYGITPTVIEYDRSNSLVYIGNQRLIKFDPWTGGITLNVSIAPLSSGNYYMNGYALSVQNLGGGNYRLINWTTLGSSSNFASRIENNRTWPWSSLGYVDYEAGIAARTESISPSSVGIPIAANVTAASLETGQVLWEYPSGVGFSPFSGSTNIADHGKFAVRFNDGNWYCWNLLTGTRIWKAEGAELSWPWGDFGTYNVASYGGMIISSQFDGVQALDWDTGDQVWYYIAEAPYPYESPYTGPDGQAVYPFHSHCMIADGKLFISNAEHTATQPATRGWKLHAINITTGKHIWSIITAQSGLGDASRVWQGAIADGYLIYNDLYSGTTYAYGRGKSATTVTASPKTIADGATVLIEGTVLDMSPAQPGTPCVSKQSMGTWMEYLHLQMPIDGILHNETVTGVPVLLLAIDSDGNVIEIGTTTSDMSGSFQYEWTPPDEGLYKITASFLGDDSYGSSWAETGLSVGPAPQEPPEPTEPAVQEDIDRAVESLTPMFLGIIAAVAVAIVIGIVNLWALRKQRK